MRQRCGAAYYYYYNVITCTIHVRDCVCNHEASTRMSSGFVVHSVIRGHHIYKAIWEPVIGEELNTERETGNPHDPLSVAVTKLLREERRTVGHLPRRISPLCSAFLRRGGRIKCIVNGHRKYSEDLPQGGLEVPCQLLFSIESEPVCKKTEQLIRSSLALNGVEYPENQINHGGKKHLADTSKSIIKQETMAEKTVTDNDVNSKPHNSVLAASDVTPTTEVIDAENITCSPAKKKTKLDTERILMGEELTDLEINFAQELLKEQFHRINGLQSTLLQEKDVKRISSKNKLQIIFCKERKHWVVATTINCIHDEVKVYDSLFQYLDQTSLKCIEKMFKQDDFSPQIKMSQCRKQKGSKDCGVYAIAFATAIAFGQNPGRQNFKQEEMRAHLVNCFNKNQISVFPCK